MPIQHMVQRLLTFFIILGLNVTLLHQMAISRQRNQAHYEKSLKGACKEGKTTGRGQR